MLYYKKDPKRDPHFDNHPYEPQKIRGYLLSPEEKYNMRQHTVRYLVAEFLSPKSVHL